MDKGTERVKKDVLKVAAKLESADEETVGKALDKTMAFVLVHRAAIVRFISGLLITYGGVIRVIAGVLSVAVKPIERFVENLEGDDEIRAMVRDFEKVVSVITDAPKPDEEPTTTAASDAPPAE